MMVVPSSNLPPAQLEKARRYKSEFLLTMYGTSLAAVEGKLSREIKVFDFASHRDNIIGLGFGMRVTNGVLLEDEQAIRIYVREKVPPSALEGRAIPWQVNGVPTDIIPIGDLVATVRPTSCGVSIGHHATTAGTLGCLVKKSGEADLYILSNNHVLADCDRANIGDLILEPGPSDGGRLDNPIANLTDFEPIAHGSPNIIDAAIAKLLDRTSVTNDILGIGYVRQPPAQAVTNQRVLKYGRTTGLTEGIIVGIAEDVPIWFDSRTIDFEEQLAIGTRGGVFGKQGDSGSLVVDYDTKCPVGLFFAADLTVTGTGFANPIGPILDRFGVEVV